MTQQDFLQTYNINTTFADMYQSQKVTANKGQTVDQSKYIHGLKFMFNKFMEGQIDPYRTEGRKDMSKFDYAQFVRDYEDAINTTYTSENPGMNRVPYEGVEVQAIKSLADSAKEYSKNTIGIWKDQVQKRVDIESFRRYTQSREFTNDTEKKQNKYAVGAMYQAMKNVINERTWRWRINPLNWGRWIEENSYMRELTTQMRDHLRDDIRNRIAPKHGRSEEAIEAALNQAAYRYTAENSDRVIEDDKIAEIENYGRARENGETIQQEQKKATEQTAVNTNEEIVLDEKILRELEEEFSKNEPEIKKPEKEEERKEDRKELEKIMSQKKPRSMGDVRALISKPDLTQSIRNQFAKFMSKSTNTNADNLDNASKIRVSLGVLVSEAWKNKANMKNQSVIFFKRAYNEIKDITPGMSVGEKIVAAQKMADIMINTFTPAASDPAFKECGDNYGIKMMKNDELKELTGYEGDMDKLMDDVRADLGIAMAAEEKEESKESLHEPVQFNGEFDERKDVPKSERVNEIPCAQKELEKNH